MKVWLFVTRWIQTFDGEDIIILPGYWAAMRDLLSGGFGRYLMGGHMEVSHNTVETRVGRGSLRQIVTISIREVRGRYKTITKITVLMRCFCGVKNFRREEARDCQDELMKEGNV